MSKRKRMSAVPEAIEALLAGAGSLSTGEVAEAAGVTRQAAHRHLRRFVDEGRLRAVGAGRTAHYVPAVDLHRVDPLAGLREDAVWSEVLDEVPALATGTDAALATDRLAFTEMLNNAIDHSGGSEVEIDVASDPWFRFRVADDGVGVFRHFASRLGLEDDVAAAFELTKGKRTTAPGEHSGEGIFFTSRLVARFRLEANGLALVVDGSVNDFAIASSSVERGTTVRWEVDPSTTRRPADVYGDHTDEDLRFVKTSIPLSVLLGPALVSRAEARRVTDQLERFEEAEIDFTGVSEVGHAFLDDLFRVWATRHPGTRLVPVGAAPLIERQIRALQRRD